MQGNIAVIDFIKNNYLLLGLLILLILKIIPPEWAGFFKYNDNDKAKGKAPRITFLRLLLSNLTESVFIGFLLPILSGFGLKNTATLVIFIVVVFDIFSNHQISGGTITLIAIGVIALYLDRLIETGKELKLFGALLSWKKDEQQPTASSNVPTQPSSQNKS